MLKATIAGIAVAFCCHLLQDAVRREKAIGILESINTRAADVYRPWRDRIKKGKRTKEIEGAIPAFLRQIASCLRASLNVRQAIKECARNTPGALGEELAMAGRELDSGVPLDDVLRRLADRTGNGELKMTAVLLSAGARYGGDISGAVTTLASLARKRQASRRETVVLTAQARYSSVILGILPVAFFLFFPTSDGRGLIAILSRPAGFVVVITGLALDAAGFLVMRRILKLDGS